MDALDKTVFNDCHRQLGAQLVEFGGWEMPVQYADGIVQEHLATRKQAGLFDVSHMGRFIVGGSQALPFLQHVLTNNAAALEVGEGQYTMIPNETGGALTMPTFIVFSQTNSYWWSTPPTEKRIGTICRPTWIDFQTVDTGRQNF